MLILYDKQECPFCWRVRLALSSQGCAYQVRHREDPEVYEQWRKLTPTGTVPVLVHGELIITESGVMLEYLHDISGALLPDGAVERVKARALLHYADAVLGRSIRETIFEMRDKPEASRDQARIERGRAGYLLALPHLEEAIGNADYFAGDRFTFAECALVPRIALAMAYGVPLPQGFPNLRRWFGRMCKDSTFAQTAPLKILELLSESRGL